MEKRIMSLQIKLDLTFAYLKKYKDYDQLIKNEGNDKYILTLVYLGNNEENVYTIRVSEVIDPELSKRTLILDQGVPIAVRDDNKMMVFNYLSEVKEFTEKILSL